MNRENLIYVVLVVVLIVLAIDLYVGIRAYYFYEREVQSHWELADRSSTIAEKARHIDNLVAALDRQGLAGQHDALFFPTPDNGFDENFTALKSLQARLREIQTMDVASFEYQTAIQQITAQEQGEAQPMLDALKGAWWKTHHFFLWYWLLMAQIIISFAASLTTFIWHVEW